jgi:parallel beta-helix repeat protein
VYPLSCTDVLVEDCDVTGAADAGIYVGQSKRIIVRNNTVRANVAGIEIENSDDALVTGNLAIDNTAGILVFVMPNLEKKDGARTLVENNVFESNNRVNFGEKGTTVSFVPKGLGLLLLANDGTEVRNNQFKGNGSTGVLAVSFGTYALICEVTGGDNCGAMDEGTDPDASKTYVHDNTFETNGTEPDEVVAGLFAGIDPIENVLWDGRRPSADAEGEHFCLGKEPSTLRVFGDQEAVWALDRSMDITDPAAFDCVLPPLDTVTLPQDG